MKKLLVILICFVSVISLLGCRYREYYGRTPCDQPNTTWISEDERIIIKIDANQQGIGNLILDDKKVDFIFITAGPTIYLYMPEAKDRLGLYPEEQYEYWYGEYKYDNQFTATVIETTFFTKGNTITFYRVDGEQRELMYNRGFVPDCATLYHHPMGVRKTEFTHQF